MKRRALALIALTAVFSAVAPAHYHFIRFAGRTAPWRAMHEKFDLNVLPNRTVSYFIGEMTNVQLGPSDSHASLVSQIRAAASIWDSVQTSDLRVAFGGLGTPASPQSTPSIDVIFEELPPGVPAIAGPTIRADSNGAFVPILKSVVILSPDRTPAQRASYTEATFGTLVHEIGHAIGLQHTLTSSAMSQDVTRATSKARPLTVDDIAGVSVLYPARTFQASTGTISGRVVLQGGQGVNLASVVAISPSGAAISTLTNPDGTYRIEGVPPRNYYVYVHPLPPPAPGHATFADIVYPVDSDGQSLGPGVPFDTVFFPGTSDVQAAFPLSIGPGNAIDNINFNVRPRPSAGIHSVTTYSFPANFAVKPPYLSGSSPRPYLIMSGSGLIANSAPAPGLRISVLGGPSALPLRPYASAPASFLRADVDPRVLAFSADAARHLVFSNNNDIYVRPSAFFHVEGQPPEISNVVPTLEGGIRAASVTGVNLRPDTRVLFDGMPAPVRAFDAAAQKLTVIPPSAAPGHRAIVTALNPDGQSSLFMQNDAPSMFTYSADGFFALAPTPPLITPAALPAGAEATLQIDSSSIGSAEDVTSIGFGSSDILVKAVQFVSPGRMLVNVQVSPLAVPGRTTITVASGLQTTTLPFGFEVQAPALRPQSLEPSAGNP